MNLPKSLFSYFIQVLRKSNCSKRFHVVRPSWFFYYCLITLLNRLPRRRIGPVAQYHENSRYYSAQKPARNPDVDSRLPHITLEMPVYKESLEDTMYVNTSLPPNPVHLFN
jgi:hypothetical protein